MYSMPQRCDRHAWSLTGELTAMSELPRTPAAIADLLGETEPQPRQQLTWIAKRLGPRGMAALVEAVLAIEAQGGIVLPTGYRRTPGGVLFWLVKTGWKPPLVCPVALAEVLQTIPTDLNKAPYGRTRRGDIGGPVHVPI